MAVDVSNCVTRSANVSDKSIVVSTGQQQSQNAGLQQKQPKQVQISVEAVINKESSAVELAASLAQLKAGDIVIGVVEHQPTNGISYIVTDHGIFSLPPEIHLDINTAVSVQITSVDKLIVAVVTPQTTTGGFEKNQIPNVQLTLVDTAALSADNTNIVALDPLPEPVSANDAAIIVRQVAEYFSNQSSLSAVSSEIALPQHESMTGNLLNVQNTPALSGEVPINATITSITGNLSASPLLEVIPTVISPLTENNIAQSNYRGLLSPIIDKSIASSLLVNINPAPVTLLTVLPEADIIPNIQPSLLAGGATLPLTSLVNSGRALFASVVDTIDSTHVIIAPVSQPELKLSLHMSKASLANLPVNAHFIIMVGDDLVFAAEKPNNSLFDTQHAKLKLLFSLMNDTFISAQSMLRETGLIEHVPTPGNKLAAQVVFLLHALKTNKLFAQQIQPSAQQFAPLSRLATSIENLSFRAASSDTQASQSRTTIVPLRIADTLVPLTIIVQNAHYDEKNDTIEREQIETELPKLFEVSVKFDDLGTVKMMGRLNATNLDIKIKSDHEFSENLKATTHQVFVSTLALDGISGKLSFAD